MDESRESLGKLRVVDLKQRLSAIGLAVGGLKAELVNRLYQHLLKEYEVNLPSEKQQEEGNEEPQQPEEHYETESQEDLYHMQQQAMRQKHEEETAKQEHLLRLQQEALKQNEDEQKQLQALGLKPPSEEDVAPMMVPAMQQHSEPMMQLAGPPPEQMMQQGPPPPEQMMQHSRPPPEQIMQQGPPPPEQMMQHSRPPLEQMMQQSRPPPEQMVQQNRPPQEQMMQQSRPPPEQMMQQNRPPPEQMMQQNRPPSEQMMQQNRPPPEQMMQQNRPPPEQMMQQNRPPPDQMMQQNRPPPDQMMQQNRPPPDQMMQQNHPPPEQMMQQNRPPPEQMSQPSHAPPMQHENDRPSEFEERRNVPLPRRTSDDRQAMHRQSSEGGAPPPLMSLTVIAPEEPKNVKLPQALEEALAFKQERAMQLGVEGENDDDDAERREEENRDDDRDDDRLERGRYYNREERFEQEDEDMEYNDWSSSTINRQLLTFKQQTTNDAEEERAESDEDLEILEGAAKKNNKQKRKKKKKKKKSKGGASGQEQWILKQMEEEQRKREESLKKKSKRQLLKEKEKQKTNPEVVIQYIQEEIPLDYSDPMHRYFAKIFDNFKISEEVPEEEEKKEEIAETPTLINNKDLKKVPKLAEDFDDSDNEENDDDKKPKVSKRKMKLMKRMSIAELKQTVSRPDVVEMHDVTAKNPKLLVHLKAARNTVSVPRHWCFKRKYLQGKRGIEKPPFELPDFIKRTGIMEMRAALQEKEDQKTLKSKMREKVRPKMGKIDIDYQKLHDAFFKWQCKPEMTLHGDLYYEGKEYETKMKDKKPGEMSDDLRIALGMPVGANAHKVPPPWLIAMQRYGPPPSYPNLKIPGLNAPIPDGCSFGYHAGGWGKPPVDNMGKPIYGDVFGTQNKESDIPMVEEEVEKSLWGELESESEEESEEEEESEDEEEDNSGLVTPGDTGLVTPSGISSLPAGLETPDMIELRKKHLESEMEGGDTPALYTILPEKRNDNIGRAMMGSSHTYDISSAMSGSRPGANQGVEVALDPSELDLGDTDAMAARYEATLREQNAGEEEDFSDMVAEHAAKQRNKRKRLQQQDHNKPTKKYKDFKF